MSVTFRCSIADTTTAWQVSGDNEPWARVKLDIPASEFAEAQKLMSMGGRILVVTVEESAEQIVFGAGDDSEVPE
jgi:hypothetical protein